PCHQYMLVSLPSGGQFEQPPPYPPPQAVEGTLTVAFADRDGDVFALAGADHAEPVRRADLEGAQLAEELIQVTHWVAINGHDRVTLQEAGRLGRTTRFDSDEQQPTHMSQQLCLPLDTPARPSADSARSSPRHTL